MADTPKIRFKGFSDDWEQRKLGEIADRTYGGGTPKTDIMEYWDGYIPWIQSSNLTEHELFNVDIQKHITDDGLKKSAAQLVPPNSVAIVSHVGVGKLVFMPFSYTTSQDFISLSELKADPIFTCYSVYKRLQNDLHIVQGSAIKGITKDDLLGKAIMLPSEPEQIRIGGYFRQLDHLITLHQRKCDETKELKKYMLQKMFPQNGKKIPEIRFAGFTDAWEQRKLSELIVEYKETVEADCELPVLTSSKTEGVLLQEEHFGRKQSHDITGYNVLPRNYCTYRNRSDGIDFTFNINKCCDKGIISKFYPVFCGKDNDTFFISLVLNNSNEVVREIGYTCTGTGQKVLSFSDLLKMYLRVPNYEEQKKIAVYFDSLDHLITLHQRKCDELKEAKKFMLYNMFPQKG